MFEFKSAVKIDSATAEISSRHSSAGGLLAATLHRVFLRLLCAEIDVALSSSLSELASTVLALNAVVSLFFHLSELGLLLMAEASAHPTVALLWRSRSRSHRLSELQGLQLPLGDLASGQLLLLLPLLLNGFGVRLCPLLLGVGIVLEALAVGIGGLPLLRYIEGLSFFNENFFANLCMLHHGLLVELAAAVVARDQTASIAILVRLLVLLVVEVGVLM